MPNFYQAVVSFLACNRIGAVSTFLNAHAAEDEINSYLNLFESSVFINFDKTKEQNIITKKNTKVKYIITLSRQNINNIDMNNDYKLTTDNDIIDFNCLGSISKFQSNLPVLRQNFKDNALILFTSGSTGKPKSVVLTNENILSVGTYLKNSSSIASMKGDRTLVCVPFTYPYGFATSTLMTLMSGKLAILGPNISGETLSYYLEKKPNIIFGSPALLQLVRKYTPIHQDLSSVNLFISGGDFLTLSDAKEGKNFFAAHGASVKICNGSGNAETVGSGTNPVGLKLKPKTVGKVLIGSIGMIVDPDTLEEKKYGEEGELCISGKNVFKEYYKEPELTASSKFEQGGKVYFKTGTRGFLDEEGYFTLTGRSSRFYIMSSLNKIYLDHVQEVISLFDPVESVAVVQVPDEENLFVNKAYIVLKDEYEPTKEMENHIRSLCNNSFIEEETGDILQLKDYEHPAYIEFINELPRAESDKIHYSFLENDAKMKHSNTKVLKK